MASNSPLDDDENKGAHEDKPLEADELVNWAISMEHANRFNYCVDASGWGNIMK